jgi:TetR/AcrR family transcriptional regulator, cholesterol catabolism regulator
MTLAQVTVSERTVGGRPSARRKLAIAAARAIAAEGGYDAVTMREVATRSGVARATLYRYFSSKDHLLAEVMIDLNLDLREELRMQPPVGPTLAERVTDAFARVIGALLREPNLLSASLRAYFSQDPAVRALGPEIRSMGSMFLEAGLGDAEVPERADIARVLGAVSFAMVLSLAAGHRSYEEAVDHIRAASRLLLRG